MMLVKPLLALIALFAFGNEAKRSDSKKNGPFSAISENVVRQMLLSADGSDVDMQVLSTFFLKLWEMNESVKVRRTGRTQDHDLWRADNLEPINQIPTSQSSNLAINDYLTVGPRPSSPESRGSACDICASIINIAGKIVHTKPVWDKAVVLAKQICPQLTGGFPQYVCDSIIDNFKDQIYFILPTIIESPYTLCNNLFSNLGCGRPDDQHYLYEVPLPERPTEIPTSNIKAEKESYKVFLMTDMHLDPHYAVGSPAVCREPLCCRSTSSPKNESDPGVAGYWGDYRKCDLPVWTWEELLRQVNETHGNEVDVVYIAGDLTPHDVWNQSKEEHGAIISMMGRTFDKWLPGKPVFYSLGNHEIVPVNLYPLSDTPKQFSAQWLYDTAAETWVKWLDPAIANATIRYAGFFTTLIKPGWRLISMNDNFCIGDNFFQYGQANITDPWGHLQWIIDVLAKAEKDGEKVHIMGHISPGGGCHQAWSWNYYRIVSRFSHIITCQFYGHSHTDDFFLWYDAETLTKPVSIGFIGPPSTPYSENNIAYRIYHVNSSNYELIDHETWYADVEEANLSGNNNTMAWRKEYSAKEAYGLESLHPTEWAKFVERMKTDDELFALFRKHYLVSYTGGDTCNENCRRGHICDFYSGLSHTPSTYCEHFYPSPTIPEDPSPKCSTRFDKRSSK